ncbi:hypothetical protein JoomaDRAFT_1595 [Galbibacter orientalis DSM 19592]|uniref:Uncharacterized protein n=1 Tax=Galbibacter orientalis DSM 19592 TaxID=926559 RepID=I3C4R4_9FLAO|nr:hypothetical protein JoomaDRAFT_1595 [Galbibacter orientalis DSM 19592]
MAFTILKQNMTLFYTLSVDFCITITHFLVTSRKIRRDLNSKCSNLNYRVNLSVLFVLNTTNYYLF